MGDHGPGTFVLTHEDGRIDLELLGPGFGIRVRCGSGLWIAGSGEPAAHGALPGDRPLEPFAGAAAWVADDRIEAHLWSLSTPFRWVLRATFADDDAMTLELRQNVAFGPPPVIRATGTAKRAS